MSVRMAIVFWLLLLGIALGQPPAAPRDPTVPSAAIRARIHQQVVADKTSTDQPTELKLRGIVLRDANQGSAILEAQGKRWMLRLDRTRLGDANFMIGNTRCTIVDFSAQSITIERDGQQWIVSQR